MTAGPIDKRDLRYRLYFWLMNLCLVASILIAINFIPGASPSAPKGELPTWYVVYGYAVLFCVFFFTPLLILGRFMRDEYAEQLFRRATDILVYVAVAAPFVIFAAATVVYAVTRAPEAPYPFSLFMVETNWWNAIAQCWKIFCMLFVFIFQFLRWKDSR